MKNLYLQVALKPTLVSGFFCVIYFLAFYFLGATFFDGSYGFDMFIPAVFCGITLFVFKKYYNHGELRFWQGLILSNGVVFGSLVLCSFYLIMHFYYFDSSFLERSANWKIEELTRNKDLYLEMGRAEKEIQFQIEKLREPSVGSILADKILRFGLLGSIYSIILSIIFRK